MKLRIPQSTCAQPTRQEGTVVVARCGWPAYQEGTVLYCYYETHFNGGGNNIVRDSFIKEGLVTLKQIQLTEATAQRAALFLLNPTSVAKPSSLDSLAPTNTNC